MASMWMKDSSFYWYLCFSKYIDTLQLKLVLLEAVTLKQFGLVRVL